MGTGVRELFALLRCAGRIGLVEAAALERDSHLSKHLMQVSAALWANRKRGLAKGLLNIKGVLAGFAGIGVSRHDSILTGP